jgi:malonate transporter
MTVLLGVVAPIFGIMLVGFLASRWQVIDERGVRGLVLFVFNFAIPMLLFRSLARIELPSDIAWGFLASFYAASFSTYALGLAVARWTFRRSLDEQAIFGMGASFSNTVLLGIPVVLTAFGPEAALPLFLIIAFHSATLMPLTVGLIQWAREDGVSLRSQVGAVSGQVFRNPIVMGLLLGFLVNRIGVTLPAPVDRFAELLGGAAVPCALFAMGASLAGYPLAGDMRPALVLTGLKLLAHPLLVWVFAVPILGVEGLPVAVAVVLGGMPSGVNVYLFGARYRAAPDVAARTVLLSSLCAVGTISALLILFAG